MSIDEQRSFARPDGRNAEAPEVIGDAPTAADDHSSASPDGVDDPSKPQPVVWPQPAATQPIAPSASTATARQQPGPYGPPPVPQHTQPLNEPNAAAPVDPWGLPGGDPWMDVTPGGPTTETVGPAPAGRRPTIWAAVGLFAAGALCGALVTGIFTGWGSNNASALSAQAGQSQGSGIQPGAQPPGQGQLGQQPRAGQGGLNGQGGQGSAGRDDGEVRLVGTLTAVTGARVTVKSAAGSATYTITSSTRIMRDGTEAQASDLRAGDVALVHAFPSSSSDGTLELIYARSTGSGSSGSGRSWDFGSGEGSTT